MSDDYPPWAYDLARLRGLGEPDHDGTSQPGADGVTGEVPPPAESVPPEPVAPDTSAAAGGTAPVGDWVIQPSVDPGAPQRANEPTPDTGVPPTAASTVGRPRRALKRKHTGLKIAASILAALVVIVGGGLGYAYWDVNHRIHTEDISGLLDSSRPPVNVSSNAVRTPGDPYAGQALNILVMGTDSRAGANAALTGDSVEGARSDTTFIMHVSADRARIDLVSIPRDILISIPKCIGQNGKTIPEAGWANMGFNAAFAYGALHGDEATGAACAIRAVEAMSNVRIDAYIVADFAGFAAIVDSVGGVDITLPCPIYSADADGLKLPSGVNHLNGTLATEYMRARTGTNLGDGSDLDRIARQHQLLQNLTSKVLSLNYFTQFSNLYNFVSAAAESVTTNVGKNLAEMAGFAYSLKNFKLSDMNFYMVPVAGAGDGVHVTVITSQAKPIWTALSNDTPLPGKGQTIATAPDTSTPTATPGAPSTSGSTATAGTSASSSPSATATPKCKKVPGVS